MRKFKKGEKVKIIGGRFEDKNMMGYFAIVNHSEDNQYIVGGRKTRIVYINFLNFADKGQHCFNDCHLINLNK